MTYNSVFVQVQIITCGWPTSVLRTRCSVGSAVRFKEERGILSYRMVNGEPQSKMNIPNLAVRKKSSNYPT
jgi:hypothetical protein